MATGVNTATLVNSFRGYPNSVGEKGEQKAANVAARAAATISGTVSSGITVLQNAAPGDLTSVLARVAAYLFGIIAILIVLSLLVHYFVTPIYSVHPGAPGLIVIPGFDDGVLFWNGISMSVVANKDTPIVNAYYNYTMQVDLFIQNPMQFSPHPRILLSRGAIRNQTPVGDTITGLLSNYNLVVALQPNTTDLIISVLNAANQSENVIIENAPVQTPFRLGMVVMENAMEIYINGKLHKTRKYAKSLKDVKGDISPAIGPEISIAKMHNLKIWPRALSSPEVAQATPAMEPASAFLADKIPSSTACPSMPLPLSSMPSVPKLPSSMVAPSLSSLNKYYN